MTTDFFFHLPPFDLNPIFTLLPLHLAPPLMIATHAWNRYDLYYSIYQGGATGRCHRLLLFAMETLSRAGQTCNHFHCWTEERTFVTWRIVVISGKVFYTTTPGKFLVQLPTPVFNILFIHGEGRESFAGRGPYNERYSTPWPSSGQESRHCTLWQTLQKLLNLRLELLTFLSTKKVSLRLQEAARW